MTAYPHAPIDLRAGRKVGFGAGTAVPAANAERPLSVSKAAFYW